MNGHTSLLTTIDLSIGYKSGGKMKIISENLNLALRPGELVCLLGPNGAGKSTLMRTLAGLHPALNGDVIIENQNLGNLKPSDLAKKMSLVLTERIEAGNLTAGEVVSLGRTPYTGWLGSLTSSDYNKINEALAATEMTAFKSRRINQLSDGERQKVMLARALAQDTDLILLDEPTAHLDLPNRVEMMHLLHSLAHQTNKAILLSTHELDFALQAADQLWILNQEGKMSTGIPEDLVLSGDFEAAFTKTGFYFDRNSGVFTMPKIPVNFELNVTGNSELSFWTKRALEREGFGTNSYETRVQIGVKKIEENTKWTLTWDGENSEYYNLESLVNAVKARKMIRQTDF